MLRKQAVLTDFHILRPKHETPQEQSSKWFIKAHVKAEEVLGNKSPKELKEFKKYIREKIEKVCCKPHQVSKRGHNLDDFLHDDWEKMDIFNLDKHPEGKNLSHRSKLYRTLVNDLFDQFYKEEKVAPNDIIHVSCTGYTSPSGEQTLCSKKNWDSTITHAYHMGCYAAIPAIRMGCGFLKTNSDHRCDIVHTELCSLHPNPSKHELDQLVTQSLFADGYIRYSIKEHSNKPHLKIITTKEKIIPDSTSSMTWDVHDWGFQMHLAKEIPVLITKSIKQYLEEFFSKAQLTSEEQKNILYAVHPGGPKILDYIKKLLDLKDNQIQPSYDILYEYGNMSSATLPHVWDKILKENPNNPYIVSLAFGPGLTIAGCILKKEES